MRIPKSEIRARVHDLPIAFSEERISAHGGLELVRRFLDLIDFRSRVRVGMRVTAIALLVLVGIKFNWAARARRGSLCAASCTRWVLVGL